MPAIAKKIKIKPMSEGHPEPFHTPRTIPMGWDLSEFFASEDHSRAEVNGTAYDKRNGKRNERKDNSKNPV